MHDDDEKMMEDPMIARIAKQLQAPISTDTAAFDARVMDEVRASYRDVSQASRSRAASREIWIGLVATFIIGTGLGWFAHGHVETTAPRAASASAGISVDAVSRTTVVPAVMSSTATVRFRLSAAMGADAQHVTLAGSFNGWNPMTIPLRREADGSWVADVPLTAGRYVYQFVIDGVRWIPDPTAPSDGDNDFGTPNSVITVASGV